MNSKKKEGELWSEHESGEIASRVAPLLSAVLLQDGTNEEMEAEVIRSLDNGAIWEAIDDLGTDRIGHGCSAIGDEALMARLARDRILVECCPTSNYQTGAVKPGQTHPIIRFLEKGIPVAICTDNTTVSATDQNKENGLFLEELGLDEIERIHREAAGFSFIRGHRAGVRGQTR